MRVLLTGGTGMVGRNLQARCPEPVNYVAPRRAELNLLDAAAVQSYCAEGGFDAVIHAAGTVGGIQANMREPVRFLTENWEMGQNVVLAAREAGIRRLINLGSSCMYPRDQNTPLKEEQVLAGELEPTNEGYAIAKCAVARLCRYVAAENEALQYKTLIPSNLYGPFDNYDPASSHLVPAIIHKLHEARESNIESVEIWGDGTARREFLFAADLADMIGYALQHYVSLPELMNVGLGRDYTINEYYKIGAEVVGYTGSFTHDLSKPTGMKRKLVDTNRAAAWGWQATTSVEDGMAQAYQHYLKSRSLA